LQTYPSPTFELIFAIAGVIAWLHQTVMEFGAVLA
jgi:hypothetical protein